MQQGPQHCSSTIVTMVYGHRFGRCKTPRRSSGHLCHSPVPLPRKTTSTTIVLCGVTMHNDHCMCGHPLWVVTQLTSNIFPIHSNNKAYHCLHTHAIMKQGLHEHFSPFVSLPYTASRTPPPSLVSDLCYCARRVLPMLQNPFKTVKNKSWSKTNENTGMIWSDLKQLPAS